MTTITLQELYDVFNTEFKNYDTVVECTFIVGPTSYTGYVISRDRAVFANLMREMQLCWQGGINHNRYCDKMPHASDLTPAFFYEPDSDCPNGLVCLNIGYVRPLEKYMKE